MHNKSLHSLLESFSPNTAVHITNNKITMDVECLRRMTLLLPTCLYVAENWTLTALQRRRTEAAEMTLRRPLTGYALDDYKTNYYIRRELRITGILDKIDEYRRNRLSHLQRMPQNRIPLKSYHYRPQGRRTIGRPKKRWREQL